MAAGGGLAGERDAPYVGVAYEDVADLGAAPGDDVEDAVGHAGLGEEAGDRYSVVRTIPTFLGGRSMAVDRKTGALYITHGDTHVKGERTSALELRFGWDNAEIATFAPND